MAWALICRIFIREEMWPLQESRGSTVPKSARLTAETASFYQQNLGRKAANTIMASRIRSMPHDPNPHPKGPGSGAAFITSPTVMCVSSFLGHALNYQGNQNTAITIMPRRINARFQAKKPLKPPANTALSTAIAPPVKVFHPRAMPAD
jgi:hypothetical protein